MRGCWPFSSHLFCNVCCSVHAALRRSRKRVRAVISTELPFLISKEFSSSQVNTPYVIKNSIDEFSNSATADMHRARWNTLFDQMDKALSEEEKQLVSTSKKFFCCTCSLKIF